MSASMWRCTRVCALSSSLKQITRATAALQPCCICYQHTLAKRLLIQIQAKMCIWASEGAHGDQCRIHVQCTCCGRLVGLPSCLGLSLGVLPPGFISSVTHPRLASSLPCHACRSARVARAVGLVGTVLSQSGPWQYGCVIGTYMRIHDTASPFQGCWQIPVPGHGTAPVSSALQQSYHLWAASSCTTVA